MPFHLIKGTFHVVGYLPDGERCAAAAGLDQAPRAIFSRAGISPLK
jgi:hypothetical protein